MIPVWPASLPQRVLAEGFNEGLREGRLQTPPERGVPKLRRGSSAVGKPILQSIKIDAEQLTISRSASGRSTQAVVSAPSGSPIRPAAASRS